MSGFFSLYSEMLIHFASILMYLALGRIYDLHNLICRKLIELDLLERLAGEVITTLIHIRIENHVQESCKGSFDTSYISSLESVSNFLL